MSGAHTDGSTIFWSKGLPARLEITSLTGTTGAQFRNNFYPRCYARVLEKGLFQTVATRVNPGHRQGQVLHPTVSDLLRSISKTLMYRPATATSNFNRS